MIDIKKVNSLVRSIFLSRQLNEEKMGKLSYEYEFDDELVSLDLVKCLIRFSLDLNVLLEDSYIFENGNSFKDVYLNYAKDNFEYMDELFPTLRKEYIDPIRYEEYKLSLYIYSSLKKMDKLVKEFNALDYEYKELLKEKTSKGGLLKILSKRNEDKLKEFEKSEKKKKEAINSFYQTYSKEVRSRIDEINKKYLNSFLEKNSEGEDYE